MHFLKSPKVGHFDFFCKFQNYVHHPHILFYLSTKYHRVRRSQFCWAVRLTFCPKSAHFCMFFAQKSAILIFFLETKKVVLRNYILHNPTKFQVSISYSLVRRSWDGRTDARTHARRVFQYPPSGSTSPWGIKISSIHNEQ